MCIEIAGELSREYHRAALHLRIDNFILHQASLRVVVEEEDVVIDVCSTGRISLV
jgi:hypothetical protein